MPKSSGQKLKLLYLLDYLKENTDENRVASMSEIISYLERNGIKAERKSIYSDIEALKDYGADIVYTGGKNGGYFLASRYFELPEIKLLIDAVQSSRFISQSKSARLTDKLASLAGKNKGLLMKRQIIGDSARTDNETVFYSIDRVFDAIHLGRQVSFRYFEYVLEGTGIIRRYRRDGKIYTVDPVSMVRSGDYYYLVAYENGEIKHYRADKLSGLKILEQETEPHNKLDMEKYVASVFAMYTGDRQFVTLHCDGSLAGVMTDRFGRDIPVRNDGAGGFYITVPVQTSPQFYSWVFSFSGMVTVAGPENAKEQMQEMLKKTYEKIKGEK